MCDLFTYFSSFFTSPFPLNPSRLPVPAFLPVWDCSCLWAGSDWGCQVAGISMSLFTRAAMQKLVTVFESPDYTWVLQREHSVVHKNQICYLECNMPVITPWREMWIVPAAQVWMLSGILQSTPTIKTYYYLYILKNKLIKCSFTTSYIALFLISVPSSVG